MNSDFTRERTAKFFPCVFRRRSSCTRSIFTCHRLSLDSIGTDACVCRSVLRARSVERERDSSSHKFDGKRIQIEIIFILIARKKVGVAVSSHSLSVLCQLLCEVISFAVMWKRPFNSRDLSKLVE